MDILDLLFPKRCINCGKGEKYICPNCLEKVQKVTPICPYCQKASIDGMTHSKCRKKYGLDGFMSFWEYEGVIRKAILSLKYKFASEVAKEIVKAVITELKLHKTYGIASNSVLVPVPMHFFKENWRGFNQAELVGKQLAQRMKWGYVDNLLTKKQATASQTELKGEERTRNIRGVFAINSNLNLVSNSYIIFDDVFTTGSTLKEAGKVLKRGGAGKVWGLTIAR